MTNLPAAEDADDEFDRSLPGKDLNGCETEILAYRLCRPIEKAMKFPV